ncbi:GNAT family N-acetyltransferase [Pantoea sp. Ap-967]|nr:GNAT family N-acetyltransferase [Pantoea sp. Ap-967]
MRRGAAMGMTFEWVDRLTDIDPADWQACFGAGQVTASYALQQTLERAAMVEGFHYLKVLRAGEVTGILACFSMDYSLTDLAPVPVQAVVRRARTVLPRLLKARLFVVGSPLATCSDMFGLPGVREGQWDHTLWAVHQQLLGKAAQLGIGFVCLKEFDAPLQRRLQQAWGGHYLVCRSPDTTYVSTAVVNGLEYADNMLSKYRNVMKKRKKMFEDAGLCWAVHAQFAEHAAAMHRLYLNVLERSNTRFERLSEAFFREVGACLGGQAYALLCFDGERLVAFELFLKGAALHPLYLGIDYQYRDASCLYFNCLYRIVEEAQAQGVPFIELGQTSYEAKFSIGAVSSPLYFFIRHQRGWVNRLLRLLREGLFPAPQIPALRNVFKHREAYLDALRSQGVLEHAD